MVLEYPKRVGHFVGEFVFSSSFRGIADLFYEDGPQRSAISLERETLLGDFLTFCNFKTFKLPVPLRTL